jgi:hypothetical protein
VKIKGREFLEFQESRHSGRWYSKSTCGRFFIKIQDLSIPIRQKWNLEQTDLIMRNLNKFNCQAVPEVVDSGFLRQDLSKYFASNSKKLYYQITEFIEPLKASKRSDLILSILEIARRGVFPNDIKKNNLGWKDSRVFFLDFDQSVVLDPELDIPNSLQLLKFLNALQIQSLNFPIHKLFGNFLDRLIVKYLFTESGQFRIEKTSRFKNQLSTRNKYNNYYRIKTRFIYAPGVREVSTRLLLLILYRFKYTDSVLDFGANLGLIGQNLQENFDEVYAYEIDNATSSLGQTLMNIEQSKVRFLKDFSSYNFSYLILFSVLQHVSNLKAEAKKLDKVAKIILVENRTIENGKIIKSRKSWERAESWNFSSVEDLKDYLLSLFPTKKKIRLIGESDKGRFVFEIS